MRTFEGKVLYMDELRGHPLVLNFWAAWCIYCKTEMPIMEKLQNEFKDSGLMVLGVHRSETESRDVGWEHAKKYGITYTLAEDKGGNIFKYFSQGINFVPMTVFIDRNGKVVERIVGPRSEETFRHLFEEAVKIQ